MASTNGTGRKGFNKTYTWTSPITELSVEYRCIPVLFTLNYKVGWQDKHPAPPVPMHKVNIGGEERLVENPTDPDYQAKFVEYDTESTAASNRAMWKKAIILDEEARALVKEMREELDVPLDGSDEEVYVQNILCATFDEYSELQGLILRTKQPTAEGIAAAKESFRDKAERA